MGMRASHYSKAQQNATSLTIDAVGLYILIINMPKGEHVSREHIRNELGRSKQAHT